MISSEKTLFKNPERFFFRKKERGSATRKALTLICFEISCELYHAKPIRLQEIRTFSFFFFLVNDYFAEMNEEVEA